MGFPIAVSQIGVIILGFADTLMVGRYGTQELAAASFVNNVFSFVTFLLLGYAYGLTPLISALFGQNKKREAGGMLRNGLIANLTYGGMLLVIMGILYFFLDRLGQPEELLPLIRPYYLIILASMLFVLIFNTVRQLTDGVTDTSVGMWILLGGNIINVFGNWVLIYGHLGLPEWGLNGAGIATLTSRILMGIVILAVVLCRKKYSEYRLGFVHNKTERQVLKKVNSISLPVSLQMGMECFAFMATAVMTGWLGTIPLAGYQVINTISQLSFLFYYSFAGAMAIRIATFEGMDDWKQLRSATKAGRNLVLIMAIGACVGFYFGSEWLIDLFTEDAKVIAAANLLMVGLMLYQFGDAMQICYANALRGTGNVLKMMWLAAFCYLLVGVPSGYIMGFVFEWGPQGVYYGLPVGISVAGILFYLLYLKIEKEGLAQSELKIKNTQL